MIKKISQWREQILSIGVEPDYPEFKIEQIRNANQGSAASFLYSFIGTLPVTNFVPAPYYYFPLGGSFLYLIGLWLSYKKQFQLASIAPWIISVLLFFWIAGAYGKNSNAYLLFIIAEIMAIYNFKSYTKGWLIIQLSLPIILAIISYLTDFSLFLVPNLSEKAITQFVSPMMYFSVLLSCSTIVWTYGKNTQKHFNEMKEAKDALQMKYTELEAVNEELTKTNEELDKFVYSVSHDLRAPITSVMGLIDLCKIDPENIPRYLDLEEKSMNKMDSFIKDILHYARNSRLEVIPQALNLPAIIKETFENLAYSHSAEEMEFKLKVTGDSNFYADEFRINIILSNLISNAIRYRNTAAKPSFLHFDVNVQPHQAQIKVSDNGIGIPAAHLEKVFLMFYRANVKSTGSGLGLYIVKEALLKMGGNVTVQSEEGVGTTFMLTIPKPNRE